MDVVDMTLIPSSAALSPFANPQAPQRSDSPASPVEVRFRHLDVLENLISVLFIPRSPAFSIRAESRLANIHRRILKRTVWIHPASAARSKWSTSTVASKSRVLVYTADRIELTVFQLSNGNQSIRTVIMEKGCNLMQAIYAAEEARKGNWVILVRGL